MGQRALALALVSMAGVASAACSSDPGNDSMQGVDVDDGSTHGLPVSSGSAASDVGSGLSGADDATLGTNAGMNAAGVSGGGADTGGSVATGATDGEGGAAMSGGDASGGGMTAGTSGATAAADAGVVVAIEDAGGGSPSTSSPSAGCELGTARPSGGVLSVSQSHYIAFPDSYDGQQPLPVLFGFHGCGGVNRGSSQDDTEWMRLTQGSAFASQYVRVVPLSADGGGCWNYNNDISRVKQMYDDLVDNYCVDTGRVFATGHSSGAQFIAQIATQQHAADAQHLGFKALSPVAASDYGPITGPIPVMYIQGMMDAERGNGDGHETVERFRTANACSDSSTPYAQVAGCQSGATSVEPGCIRYDGCQAPTIWCSHNDPAYSGTMHGVPCFGVTAMYDFFEGLQP